ncbi:FAD/NAD(P)-binding domain-containing protein [Pleomassaria siparia CBS 279.74]|uniref:FAD/NAD(P)-binding domain-containing protein n=1 Tax=Pleomassaria siparia CBS 279.74 TaxID=1314801 RepID=A0A6G1JXR5_9PLEO|nr:FAD/NAD(P)-binding domain-containing protein [Pleomassaria siparia CBS 279.74]
MHIHDVLIIGAGPCGLAVAARLHEHTPSATFTDDEHQRYHWIRKHGRRMNIKNYRTNTDSFSKNASPDKSGHGEPSKEGKLDMLVLDADGAAWMTKWNRLFKKFGIQNLRSPMFFHVDPADRDALLGYTYEKDREKELQALPGCVGKEVSKHRKKKKRNGNGMISQTGADVGERDRKDYFTPSSSLFTAHCEEVARRYGIGSGLVQQERVQNIEYSNLECYQGSDDGSVMSEHSLSEDQKVFRVTTDKGIHLSHVVVLAVGPGNAPLIPPIHGLTSAAPHEGYCHALQLGSFPPPNMALKIERRAATSMLIVGGGLTSVQLADLAIRRGVSKVWLLMRGDVKVKYFDIELDWVGKFRNVNQASFWSADTDQERLDMFLQARNGGSITPRYRKILDAHIASGKVSLHTNTTLKSVSWSHDLRMWTSTTTTPESDLPSIDFIVFSTGMQTNINAVPFLNTIQQQYPIDCVGGFPCLNNDLMWSDDVPLFINGRLAGLRLGPGAPNLVGARAGAERIAWNVEDVLQKLGRARKENGGSDKGRDEADDNLLDYAAGRKNRFGSLVDIDSN